MGKHIVIIGGGPAGLSAAIAASGQGASVRLLEKQADPGRKLLLSGAGQCNLTNTADLDRFIEHYFGHGRFLYPAFGLFFRTELIELLADQHVPVVMARQGKIFPASGRADDVLQALLRQAAHQGVKIIRSCQALQPILDENHARITGIHTSKGKFDADAVILATGGRSYPKTGSTGDGYAFAEAAGHAIVPIRPALVPLTVQEAWVKSLSGISSNQVQVDLTCHGQAVGKDRGDLLFTHFGLSGPVILRLSRLLPAWPPAAATDPDSEKSRPAHDADAHSYLTDQGWAVRLDFFPTLKPERLQQQIQAQLDLNSRQYLVHALNGLLPARLMQALLASHDFDPARIAGQVGSKAAEQLAAWFKQTSLPISGSRGYAEAMATAGGVDLRQVDPATMQSRLKHGLYFAGEVLDLDGDTGGYNLQAAFSTGWLAGIRASG